MNDLTELAEKLKEAGKEWVKADEEANLLEKTKDSFLSELKCKLDDGKLSDAKLTTQALASIEYKAHIKGMVSARARANLAKVKMTYYDKLWESKRSEMTLTRTQIERGIYKEGR